MPKEKLHPVNRNPNPFLEKAKLPAQSGYHPTPPEPSRPSDQPELRPSTNQSQQTLSVDENPPAAKSWRDEPTMAVKVPQEVADEIDRLMYEKKMTKRAVVLDLLRRGGIKVPKSAITDKRKTRHKP